MGNKLYKIYKISTDKIINSRDKNQFNLGKYSYEDAVMNGEVVSIMDNQVLHKIRDYYKNNNIADKDIKDIANDLLNIIVPMDTDREDDYRSIAKTGFWINDNEYTRLCSGSGQIRRNTITFIRKELYNYLFEALCCGLTEEDFGDDFNVAKFNAYFGLNMSGCKFLSETPRVCIISDFEQIRPHIEVDYIETEIQTEKPKSGKGRGKKIIKKYPVPKFYDEIENVPALNSFDGQGLVNSDYAVKMAKDLGYDYVPSQFIIRAPWIKGLLVNFRWKDYLRQHNVTMIKDIDGIPMRVKDIDILISASQWKMHKIYSKKGGEQGGWKYYTDSMKKYNLKWGVVMPNKKYDDDIKTSNYQYNSALNLDDVGLDSLCKLTEEFLTNLCSGNLEQVYKSLIIHKNVNSDVECSGDDMDSSEEVNEEYHPFLQKAVTHNIDLLKDRYIQDLIMKDCKAKFNAAKIGKLLTESNYQFLVSDPVAQVQHVIKNHAIKEIDIKTGKLIPKRKEIIVEEVNGLLKANEAYSYYWNKKKWDANNPRKLVLMRSPLIDRSEVVVADLKSDGVDWYSTITSGIILSIWDLATLQMQNCDYDGDRCYSSRMDTLITASMKNPKPLMYPSATTQLTAKINQTNCIEADIRGLNSKVGSISNKSAAFYAMLALYEKDSEEYNELLSRIKVLGEIVGVEIDKIKTGVVPIEPTSWKPLQYEKKQSTDINGKVKIIYTQLDEEKECIRKHNSLIPDKKPYFMRYIYNYLNKDIETFRYSLNQESLYSYGLKIDELLKVTFDGNLIDNILEKQKNEKHKLDDNEEFILSQWRTKNKYERYFPVIDSSCIMNKICHRFEELERKFSSKNDGNNMLAEYITSQSYDSTILTQIELLSEQYSQFKRFLTKNNNSNCIENGKAIAKNTKERLSLLYEHIFNQILDLCDNDVQTAFNYMVKATGNNDTKFVWDVLGDRVLEVIPNKPIVIDNV